MLNDASITMKSPQITQHFEATRFLALNQQTMFLHVWCDSICMSGLVLSANFWRKKCGIPDGSHSLSSPCPIFRLVHIHLIPMFHAYTAMFHHHFMSFVLVKTAYFSWCMIIKPLVCWVKSPLFMPKSTVFMEWISCFDFLIVKSSIVQSWHAATLPPIRIRSIHSIRTCAACAAWVAPWQPMHSARSSKSLTSSWEQLAPLDGTHVGKTIPHQ